MLGSVTAQNYYNKKAHAMVHSSWLVHCTVIPVHWGNSSLAAGCSTHANGRGSSPADCCFLWP